MSDVVIYDNFLTDNQFNNLQNTLMSAQFPWHYSDYKVGGYDANNKTTEFNNKNIFSFVHNFYHNFSWQSPYAESLQVLLNALHPISLIRIKANLTTITNTPIVYEYHRDTPHLKKFKTAIFYVNTNNGRTIFASGQEVESVANRLIIFDSDNLHTGTSCTDESRRVLINFNYFIDN